jgi:transcriptional regulator with XRE-family HTH domain
MMLGMRQPALAEAMGIPLAQVRNYERGAKRISARRLYALGCALGVPVTFFFEGQTGARQPAKSTTSPKSHAISEPSPPELHSALRLLLAVVDLADRDNGIDDQHYRAARENARALLAGFPHP